MKVAPSLAALLACALTASAGKAPVVIAPCDCAVMKGEERWAAKTDPQPAPVNTAALPRLTPADICAWPAPAEKVPDGRMPAEQQWYALICRIVAMKLEDDGDLHIEVENADGRPGRVVIELPCGATWCEMRKHVVEWTKANIVLKRGRLSTVSPHNIIAVGKAFYDIDHAKRGTNERHGNTPTAVWEIHPVMKVIDGDAKLGSGF